jgi:curved DNA-binding protein CbpA
MQYFNNVTSIEEAKKIYRELAKQHHPDKGGDVEVMKAINNEYDFICAKILKGEHATAEEFNSNWEASQLFKERINSIINTEGLIIEIVGLWIWVTGNTYPNRELLKSSGYFFASKKQAWYWRPEHAAGGRGKYNLEQLKNKYGSERVTASNYESKIKAIK